MAAIKLEELLQAQKRLKQKDILEHQETESISLSDLKSMSEEFSNESPKTMKSRRQKELAETSIDELNTNIIKLTKVIKTAVDKDEKILDGTESLPKLTPEKLIDEDILKEKAIKYEMGGIGYLKKRADEFSPTGKFTGLKDIRNIIKDVISLKNIFDLREGKSQGFLGQIIRRKVAKNEFVKEQLKSDETITKSEAKQKFERLNEERRLAKIQLEKTSDTAEKYSTKEIETEAIQSNKKQTEVLDAIKENTEAMKDTLIASVKVTKKTEIQNQEESGNILKILPNLKKLGNLMGIIKDRAGSLIGETNSSAKSIIPKTLSSIGTTLSPIGSNLISGLGTAAKIGAPIAAIGAGYKAGQWLNENTGIQEGISKSVDTVKGWFGNSDEDKIKAADLKSAQDLYNKRVTEGKLTEKNAAFFESQGINVDKSKIIIPETIEPVKFDAEPIPNISTQKAIKATKILSSGSLLDRSLKKAMPVSKNIHTTVQQQANENLPSEVKPIIPAPMTNITAKNVDELKFFNANPDAYDKYKNYEEDIIDKKFEKIKSDKSYTTSDEEWRKAAFDKAKSEAKSEAISKFTKEIEAAGAVKADKIQPNTADTIYNKSSENIEAAMVNQIQTIPPVVVNAPTTVSNTSNMAVKSPTRNIESSYRSYERSKFAIS